MSTPSPAMVARARAEAALLPGMSMSFDIDSRSDPDCVLLAVARSDICWVMRIARSEYTPASALETAALLGCPIVQRPERKTR